MFVLLTPIHWIASYSMDSVIDHLNNRVLDCSADEWWCDALNYVKKAVESSLSFNPWVI